MALKFREKFRSKTAVRLADQELVGLLEPGVEFEGKMTISSGMVRLNTHFKGEVNSSGALIVAEQGELEGEVNCGFISVGGKVKGAVHATEKVEIRANGVVLGDIFTASLVVEPGGYFDGQCHMPTPISENQPAEVKAEQKA